MATVLSPSSSPSVFYNGSGVTIDNITAAGSTQADATAIVRFSGCTVLMLYSDDTSKGIKLPADANVGDLVEIHAIGYSAKTYPPSGESISGYAADAPYPGLNDVIYRKVSATNWRIVSLS